MATVQDALAGIEFMPDLPDDELVSDAIVLVRMVNKDDGQESFFIAESANLSPIIGLGMITAAAKITNTDWEQQDGDA